MTDLIDRQALLVVLTKTRDECAERSKTYGDKDPLDEDQWESMAEIYSDVIKQVEAAPTRVTLEPGKTPQEVVFTCSPIPPITISFAAAPPPEPEEGETMWRNHYVCPKCKHEWTDEWPAQCDDDCPKCGCRHISPTRSEEADAGE